MAEPLELIVDNTMAHPPTDYVTSFMPVFSDQLVEAFRKAGVNNFQTYKAILKNTNTGESWDKYQVVNILGKIACADLENSVYKVLIGTAYRFSDLVIDDEKANGALFFRLLESHDKIIVQNDVLDFMYTEEDDPIFEGLDFELIRSKQNL